MDFNCQTTGTYKGRSYENLKEIKTSSDLDLISNDIIHTPVDHGYYRSLNEFGDNILTTPTIIIPKQEIYIHQRKNDEKNKVNLKINRLKIFLFKDIFVINWAIKFYPEIIKTDLQFSPSDIEEFLSDTGAKITKICFDILEKNNQNDRKKSESKNASVCTKVFWTARILQIHQDQDSMTSGYISHWTNDTSKIIIDKTLNIELYIGWGNGAWRNIEKYNKFDDILLHYATIQYLYAGLQQVSDETTMYFSNLQQKINSKELSRLVKKIKEIEHRFSLYEYTLIEAKHKLQGIAFSILASHEDKWRFRFFIDGIRYKIQQTRILTTDIRSEKYGAVQKTIRNLLVAIGVVELLGAFVEIIHLANSSESAPRYKYGLLHLIHRANPDILFSLIAAFLVIIAILILLTNAKGEGE